MSDEREQSTVGRLLRWFWRDGQVWIVVVSLLFLTFVLLRYAGVLGGKP